MVLPHLASPYDSLSLPCYFFWFWHVLFHPVSVPLDCVYKMFSSHNAFIIFTLDFPILCPTLNKNELHFRSTYILPLFCL